MRRPLAYWIALRSSLWFVPTLVVLGSIVTATAVSRAGAIVPAFASQHLPPGLTFSPQGSRAMLSAIATSMITVAGVAFSVTVVALSLSSQQYSPRVLRQFMRDRTSQWVLGIFVGIFAYCLAVLPSIHGQDDHASAPSLAVLAGIAYAIVGVGCLVLFIHHVATSVQASHIVAEIAAETRAAGEVQPHADEPCAEDAAFAETGNWRCVPAPAAGYLQLVDEELLFKLACRHDSRVRVEQPVGAFLVDGTTLLSYRPVPAGDDDRFAAALLRAFTIRRTRTVEQDVLFGIRQIADVALRALSPSLNDPTTAALCVNYLTTILRGTASRRAGDRQRSGWGEVRLLIRGASFADLLAVAFGEIRDHAASEPTVLRELLRGLAIIAENTTLLENRAALAAEASALWTLLARFPELSGQRTLLRQANSLLSRLAPPT